MVGAKIVFVLLAIFLSSAIAEAHYDPPGSPAIEVRVYIMGVALTENMDDGYDGAADVKINYEVTHEGHDSNKGSKEVKYDWDAYKGKIKHISPKILAYSHKECSPMEEITVKLNLKELDVFSDTSIGEKSVTVTKPEKITVNVGKAILLIEVEAVPIDAVSEKCSWFYDQPDGYASSIVTNSGGFIYDWQLANMIKMWIAEKGYANLVFIFNQCFGGGMIDDLKGKLVGTGDAAFLSASKHDESSLGLRDNYNPDSFPKLKNRGFTRPEDFYPKEVGEEFEKTGKNAPTIKEIARTSEREDVFGPYGLYKEHIEHPQYTSIGKGDDIKIGKKADGSDVASKHAILFAGDANGLRHWNDVDRAYKALRGHGFSDDNIVVLVGDGKKRSDGSDAPAYVDGPGTKKALYEAIQEISKKMNKNEQLVFWVSDHGNRERFEDALNDAIEDPVKTPIPPRKTAKKPDQITWDLDESFLNVMALDPYNQPYVSIIVEPPALDEPKISEFLNNIEVYLNGEKLTIELIDPIVAYDDDPDLDGYELVYPVKEELLDFDNLIEVGWGGNPEEFKEYEVLTLQISTGAISEFTVELNESEVTEELSLFELLKEKKDEYNKNVNAVPGLIKNIIGNERINIEISLDNGDTLVVGAVTKNAYVTEFTEGRLLNPTIRAWTDEGVVTEIIESKDFINAAVNAINTGKINYEGVGFANSIKINALKSLMGMYNLIRGIIGAV